MFMHRGSVRDRELGAYSKDAHISLDLHKA